jgi:hypothetical protein
MATLALTFNTLSTATHDLQASMLGWHKVGSCTITANSPYQFAANGNYSVLGQSGTFDLTLSLDDNNPTSTTGPCTIVNAGKTLTGTYTLNGTTLTFTDGTHTVAVSPDPGGVILAVSGYPKARIAS